MVTREMEREWGEVGPATLAPDVLLFRETFMKSYALASDRLWSDSGSATGQLRDRVPVTSSPRSSVYCSVKWAGMLGLLFLGIGVIR